MAKSEGTSFENPVYEPHPWDDDDYGDETTPFIPNEASTPAHGEEIEMQTMAHEKAGLPETCYAETNFGAQESSERAWIAAKDLFPNMSSSEIEVSYGTNNRLQVKMWGAGKKSYNLMTTEKSTGLPQINKSLPKEIRAALGESKYETERETMEMREKSKKQMDELREKVRIEQEKLGSLEDAPQRDIDKLKAKIRTLETEHFKPAQNLKKLFLQKTLKKKKMLGRLKMKE